VRGHHAGVDGVELPANPLRLTPVEDPVDAIGDHQKRAVIHLRHEVAKRNAYRPRQANRSPVARDCRKVTVGGAKRRGIAAADCGHDIPIGRSGEPGCPRTDEIDCSIDAFNHGISAMHEQRFAVFGLRFAF
jgi:hypothetical protein